MLFNGITTALITPFRQGKVDEKAFGDFVEWQIAQGVQGVVPCGTTGESPTLSYAEHERVIELCVQAARGRVKVLAGTGANATDEAVAFIRHAETCGADGALVVTPYYNKPTPDGVFAHYKAVHDASGLPIILYNVPGRTGLNLSNEVIARLAELPRIVGIKDATGDLARVSLLRAKLGTEFQQISGEDMTMVAFNAAGGIGCISVTSNVAPKLCAQVQKMTLEGDYKSALQIHDRLVGLHDAMFCETSPGPVKFAASLMGKCAPELRLPLVMPTAASQARVREAMAGVGLV